MLRTVLLPAILSTWRAKKLWLLALLTLTPLTIMNEWALVVRIINAITNPSGYFWFFTRIQADVFGFRNILDTAIADPIGIASLIITFILILTLVFFFAWIIMNAQAVVIFTQAPKNKKTGYSLQAALAKVERLWIPLLQLNISLVLARILIISALLLAALFLGNDALRFLYWILFFCGTVAITLLSFTIRFAIFKVILEKKNIVTSMKESWTTVKENSIACYEVSLTLYLFTLVVLGVVLFLIFLLVSPVEFGITILSILLLQAGPVPFIVALAAVLIMAIISGWLALITYTVWLTWYTEVTDTGTSRTVTHRVVQFIRSHVRRTTIN